MANELKTPLYEKHVARGGKMVPFARYLLPVQYAGVIEEHMAVREKAGLFDVSHMGEVMLEGKDALKNLNHLLTNDFTDMADGRARYSPMCNESGGIVDDLLVYRFNGEKYMIVINASNREKDVDWMKSHLSGDVALTDISDDTAEIALQGPQSKMILSKLCDAEQLPKKYYTFVPSVVVAGVDCLVSRTGYTGELGYELYCEPKSAEKLWDALLDAGNQEGLIPAGLGARDTLRLEASMPLYGHEMSDDISPLEAGLDFAVKMEKDDFIGKGGIEDRGVPARRRVGLKMTSRGIAREECIVHNGDKTVGIVTSGTHLPYLGGAYAMALIDTDCASIGQKLIVDVRGRDVEAEVVLLPFYSRKSK